MIKLLLVHQARLTCELFAAVLRDEPDVQIVGTAEDKQDALKKAANAACNTVLIDINLPDGGAMSLVRALRQRETDVSILVMGLVNSKSAILYCIEEGIDGYVLESESLSILVKKLRDVRAGRYQLSPSVASALIARVADLKRLTQELYGVSRRWEEDMFTELTPREWEVLMLIEKNYNNQEIAEELVITPGTAKNHVHNILSKLDVSSREQAALLMRQMLANGGQESTGPAKSPLHTVQLSSSRGVPSLDGNGRRRRDES